MKWNEGHNWTLNNLNIPGNIEYFQYKYVVLRDGKPDRWEQGFNRIADLNLLKREKELILNDQFDRYTANFSMYYPVKTDEHMKINGDPEELGRWSHGAGPVSMGIAKEYVVWLTGESVKPWEYKVTFK